MGDAEEGAALSALLALYSKTVAVVKGWNFALKSLRK